MLSKYKRRVALLSAVALAGTMLALAPASPAMAAVKVPLARAQFDACPSNAGIPSAGFDDTTSADVDCLAYYGITTGTTATTYSPDDPVTRWQMALYLTRAGGSDTTVAGVNWAAAPTSDFTDISGKSAEIQTAINQIADKGITVGKTATTFAPDDNVTREEMALFIERWLTNVDAGPGGANDSVADDDNLRTSGVGVGSSASDQTTNLVNYTDIASGTTYEGRNAIAHNWHLGITSDDCSTAACYSTTYRPNDSITRSEMAKMMAAALDHTNARPSGLVLQASNYDATGETATSYIGGATPTLSLSNRDASFGWTSGTVVDVFGYKVSTTEGQEEFSAAGLCNAAAAGPFAASTAHTKCYVDANDQTTNASGNMVPTVTAMTQGKTYNYYAWTGATGTSYDNDLHLTDASKLTLSAGYGATSLGLTCDIDAQASVTTSDHTVPFGKDIVCTAQTTLSLTGSYTHTNVVGAVTAVTCGHVRVVTTSPVDAVTPDGSTTITSTTVTSTAAATGSATCTMPAASELAAGTGTATTTDVVDDVLTVTVAGTTLHDKNLTDADSVSGDFATCTYLLSAATSCTMTVTFVDTADVFTTGALALSSRYGQELGAGVSRSATYSAYDQYGDPFAGASVTFSSVRTLPASLTAPAGGDTWTSDVAHGLSAGDVVVVAATNNCVPLIGTTDTTVSGLISGQAAGHHLDVTIATSTTTLQLKSQSDSTSGGSAGILHGAATCASGTDGYDLTTRSFSTATAYTTSAAGTASYAWTDTEDSNAGGVDTVHAVGVSGSTSVAKSKAYWATQNVHSTADATTLSDGTMTVSNWTRTLAGATTATDDTAITARSSANDAQGAIVHLDATNDIMIVRIITGDASDGTAGTPTNRYVQYQYDSNDQFCYNKTTIAIAATCQTGATMATFESQISGAPAVQLGNPAFSGTDEYSTTAKGGGGPITVNYTTTDAGISIFHIG